MYSERFKTSGLTARLPDRYPSCVIVTHVLSLREQITSPLGGHKYLPSIPATHI